MSTHAQLDGEDLAFEQQLLGAGRADVVPSERTDAALLDFAAGVAALQSSALGANDAVGSATATAESAWSRASAIARWIAVGAVAGGMATLAWLRHGESPRPTSAPSMAIAPAALTSTTSAAFTAPSAAVGVNAPRPALRPASARASAVSSRPTKPASDLAAEVTALDGIRTALAIGALADAEQQLASYRRRFAAGALRSEAEVLAIDVLAAQGRKQSAAASAARFIAQHPRDPQVARVRAFLE